MEFTGQYLLESLSSTRWHIAERTLGNNHSTLIGLMVDWWISLNPASHWSMEGAPSYANKGSHGKCDAIFCSNTDAIGVLEVEGSYPEDTARKIGKYFASGRPELSSLVFGLLVVYTYGAKGFAPNKHLPPAETASLLEVVASLTSEYPKKPIIIVPIEKDYEHATDGLCAMNEYYMCFPNSIKGILFENGVEKNRKVYFTRAKV